MLALSRGRAATMARAPSGLPAGIRLSDRISLGVIARTFPLDQVQQVLAETSKASERERDLPAQVVVYYAIALALYAGSSTREVLRCLLEGLRWLWGAEAVRVAGKSGISQARSRLGEAPLRRLDEEVVRPLATRASKGAWYRDWRLVSLDGSCLEVADTVANRSEFGVPGHLVAWIGGVGAPSPTRVPGYVMRTYSGRPSSSIRFSTSTARATSLACRPSVCERSPSPMTRFQREISDSTRARQLYPEAFCQPRRPRSAIHRRCRSRCVGAISAASLGTAFARGGTTTAAAGWRAATSA